MKAIWVLFAGLGVVGAGFWIVSIMGSGPCEPPPCESATGFCQQTCNGADTFCCKAQGDGFSCESCAPPDPGACPAPPPCHTGPLLVDPSVCGGGLCCRYVFAAVDSDCPNGKCDAQGQCVESPP